MKTRLVVEVACGEKYCSSCDCRIPGPYGKWKCGAFDKALIWVVGISPIRLPACIAAQREAEAMEKLIASVREDVMARFPYLTPSFPTVVAAEARKTIALNRVTDDLAALDAIRAEREEKP